MIDLSAIKARLEAQTAFGDIKGTTELAAAEIDQRRDACFVMLADDTASENQQLMMVRQQRIIGVAVVLAITNHRDQRGEAAMDEVQVARASVQSALLGWEPAGSNGMLVYRRGRLLHFSKAAVWWQDEYEVPVLISAPMDTE